MRKSKFTPEQILQALRQAESGTTVVDICRNDPTVRVPRAAVGGPWTETRDQLGPKLLISSERHA
ncbi:MAG: transposase [Gemmatimonadaceae bacterium]